VSVVSTVAPGAVLTREGQQGGLAYVVVAGTVKATRKGRRVVMLGPGSIVGELSLLDGGPRTATVTAVDDVSLLEINGDDFARLIAHSPHFTANLLRTLAGRVRATDRRLDLLG
jgi:CRP/FNR family cyclic AMP-dependent transcriptional regulator